MAEESRPPVVWVPNRGIHDYSDAERFGDVMLLTEGRIQRFAVGSLFQEIKEGLEEALSYDYLLVSSLSIVTSIATAILAHKFGRINYLMFCDGAYIERNIILDNPEEGNESCPRSTTG